MKTIAIICAYHLEAKEIINFFDLKQIQAKPFKIYENANISLILSGEGKLNSAIATTLLSKKHKYIFNFGICGAKQSQALGKLCKIGTIVDSSSNKKHTLQTEGYDITTLDFVSTNSSDFDTTLCDMEAVGFFVAASKFVELKNIHIYKIVSDFSNPKFDKKFYEEIIDKKFVEIIKEYL